MGLGLIAACAPAPAGPTAQPAATVASPVATAAAAVASPVVAAATTMASPVAAIAAAASPAGATVVAAAPVRITAAQVTPTDVTISVQNAGSASVDMSGWKLRVGTASATLPGNSRAAPGAIVTIHTASGTSGGSDIYLGGEAAGLISGLQPGATIGLVDGQGTIVSEFALPR